MMCSRGPGIRETVRVLLTLLADCSCPHVPSESFRLAKFNKPEALDPFWRVLHHLVYLHLLLQSGDQLRELSDAAVKDSCNFSNLSHVRLCVRKHALALGYKRPQFYVEQTGSRELLFFFAWLIQEVSLVSRLEIYHFHAALHTMSIPLSPSKTFLLDNIETHTAAFNRELEALVSSSVADSLQLEHTLRKIQWLKGTLAGSGRSVENAHSAAVKLSHNTLQSTRSSATSQPKGAHQLSLHDLFLLRYPECMGTVLKRLGRHVACLESLASWRQHEPVFWQWIESVLDQLSHSTTPEDDDSIGSDGELGDLSGQKLKEDVYQWQLKLSSAIGECLEKFGTNTESTRKEEIPEQLCLPQVAVENSTLLCPTTKRQPTAVAECPHKLKRVEKELMRLQATLKEEEKTLHYLQCTLAARIV